MEYKEVMVQLKKLGTAQNRKVYVRHGAKDLYGVSFANLYKLQKKIKVDHALAKKLWTSGNSDAMCLATMIADPAKLSAKDADAWVKKIDWYMLGGMLASLVAKTTHAQKTAEKWMKSNREFTQAAGYSTISAMYRDGVVLSDAVCKRYLKTIEKEIKTAPNRTKHTMNMALICIGAYNPKMTKDAMAAAKRIGKVIVDHGDTSCKTPDAIPYMKKVIARLKKKK